MSQSFHECQATSLKIKKRRVKISGYNAGGYGYGAYDYVIGYGYAPSYGHGYV